MCSAARDTRLIEQRRDFQLQGASCKRCAFLFSTGKGKNKTGPGNQGMVAPARGVFRISTHGDLWGFPEPAVLTGTEIRRAIKEQTLTYLPLKNLCVTGLNFYSTSTGRQPNCSKNFTLLRRLVLRIKRRGAFSRRTVSSTGRAPSPLGRPLPRPSSRAG